MENLAPLYSLTQLTMSLRGYSLSQVINGLLVFFPNLKYLDLSDSAIVDDGPDDPSQAILRASQVEELRLCRIHDSTSRIFASIIGSCPKLRSLCCSRTSPAYEVTQHVNQYCQELDRFLIGYQMIDDTAFTAYPILIPMRSMALCRASGPAVVSALMEGPCATLEELVLSRVDLADIDIERLTKVSTCTITPPWQCLRRLVLDDAQNVAREDLFALLDTCAHLEELVIRAKWRIRIHRDQHGVFLPRLGHIVVDDDLLERLGDYGLLNSFTWRQNGQFTATGVERFIARRQAITGQKVHATIQEQAECNYLQVETHSTKAKIVPLETIFQSVFD